MKILAVNQQSQNAQPSFNANLKQNGAFRTLIGFLDETQKTDFYSTLEKNAKKIQNIKVLDKNPTFRLSYDKFSGINNHKFKVCSGFWSTQVRNNKNAIDFYTGGNTIMEVETLSGATIAQKIVDGIEELAESLTSNLKNSNKYIKAQAEEKLSKINTQKKHVDKDYIRIDSND